jgi:argininosuccinate lyase
MLGDIAVNRDACARAAADPLLLATDLADWLVRKGVPFRQAHHFVGEAVALAESRRISITDIPLDDWKKISPVFDPTALGVFSLATGLRSRPTHGSPNPKLVKAQLARWSRQLARQKP